MAVLFKCKIILKCYRREKKVQNSKRIKWRADWKNTLTEIYEKIEILVIKFISCPWRAISAIEDILKKCSPDFLALPQGN